MTVPKSRKRENYVSYPTDDEHIADAGLKDAKNTKKTRRNTLTEQNINIQSAATEDILLDTKKPNRVTRQTRKFAENNPEDLSVGDQEITGVTSKKKNKKSNKNKRHTCSLNDNDTESVVTDKASKKSKQIKKHSNSIGKVIKTDTNKSNISTDSFHSAAGSPLKEYNNELVSSIDKSSENQKVNTTLEIEDAVNTLVNTTFEKDSKSKRKSSVNNSTFEKLDITTTNEKKRTPRRLSIKNSIFDKIDITVTELDSTTIDNTNKVYTFGTEHKPRRSLRNSNVIDNIATEVTNTKQNSIFEKTYSTTYSVESTHNKETELNSTYDKNEISSSNSSLISSDTTVNVTFDKSDHSRISITSDDSKIGNIINTTPVLIESSMDESTHLEQSNMFNKTETPHKGIQEDLPSVTPLKREGTFTKEEPEVRSLSPKPKLSSERTPTKRMTLASPGFTPYRISQTLQSSQKEKKSLLNVTRSIEKPTRRSSLAEVVPRQTRVMFCSPVNNPGLMIQQKKKVIKSSLKGSNKSFLFEENGKHCS